MNNMLAENHVNLYIASKDVIYDDIFVNPKLGSIYRDTDGYRRVFNEYVRDDKLYIVIDGIMYNKAKLIYDSVYKDSLPKKRYKVIVTDGNITKPTIDNIRIADVNETQSFKATLDELVNVTLNDIETEINVEYLLKMLSEQKYKLITNTLED